MDRSAFVATVVSVGPLEGVSAHVGWSSNGSGDEPHLIIMRGEGEDQYCLVSGDAETYATHYGGVRSLEVTSAETVVTLDAAAATELMLPTTLRITHTPGTVDLEWFTAHVDQVMGDQGGRADGRKNL